MNRKKMITIFSLGALIVAAAFGAVAYRSASAATATPVATTGTSNTPTDLGFKGGGRGGFDGGYTNPDLAQALGITVDELNTAYQTANAAALKQAVEKGLITQAQADELSTNGSAFPFGDRWGGWMSQNGIDTESLLAEALGITVDKLQAAYIQAYNANIDQAVTDGKLTQDQADLMKGQYALRADKNFQSAMQTAYEAAVQQAVKDGVITQAQADQILKSGTGTDFKGPGGLPGMNFGETGSPHGHGRQAPGNNNPPANPADTTVPTATP